MKQLEGKIAIVTGGTQGLGSAIARLFAQRGAAGVVICGRNREKGEANARSIAQDTGAKVIYVAADLARVEDCRAIVARADSAFGRIDTLVNAAAITDRGTLLDTSVELFDQIFAVNVRAPFFLTQDTVKVMLREKIAGTIVNIGSMSSLAGQPFIAAYCSSKGALATMTRNFAYSLLLNRIRVNGLNIGWMASDGEDRIMRQYHGAEAGWQQKAVAVLPNGRLIVPEEVARAAAFLASDESGLMTGSMVEYDQSVWGGYDASPKPVSRLAV